MGVVLIVRIIPFTCRRVARHSLLGLGRSLAMSPFQHMLPGFVAHNSTWQLAW